MNDDSKQVDLALAEADRCVLCGLCLPHCPTYNITRNESYSPRGRIALIRALLRGQLAAGPTLAQSVNSCLSCLQCQRHCPAGVAYQQVLDAGLHSLARQQQSSYWLRLRARVTLLPGLLRYRMRRVLSSLKPKRYSDQRGS